MHFIFFLVFPIFSSVCWHTLPHTCYVTRSSSWFSLPKLLDKENMSVSTIPLLITQFSPSFYFCLFVRPTSSTHHSVLKLIKTEVLFLAQQFEVCLFGQPWKSARMKYCNYHRRAGNISVCSFLSCAVFWNVEPWRRCSSGLTGVRLSSNCACVQELQDTESFLWRQSYMACCVELVV